PAHEPHKARRHKTGDLRVASVYGVAAEGADGGGDRQALAGNARGAPDGLRPAAGGTARHGYFCGLFAAREAIEGCKEAEVAALHGGGRSTTDVSRVARFGNPGDESERCVFCADQIGRRWPEMRVVHLTDYDQLPEELPDTDIFVGYSLRAKQLKDAKKLKWLHSTAAGVAQLMYPELRDSGILVTNPSGVFSVPM